MTSRREIQRAYEKLLKAVATDDFYTKVDLNRRENLYTCESCRTMTKTRDIDSGVTPFMIACPACGEMAQSSFYAPPPIANGIPVTIEWYRPSLEETLKLRKKPHELDHVLQGGLLSRAMSAPFKIKLIAEDYKGNLLICTDCPAARALKRITGIKASVAIDDIREIDTHQMSAETFQAIATARSCGKEIEIEVTPINS